MEQTASVWCRGGVRLELAAAGAPLPLPWRRAGKSRAQVVAGIHIDRRRYFERVLKRQLELEAREAEALRSCPLECIREVFTLSQFENVLYDAEQTNKLVMIDFYSSSCGACKYLLPQVINLCKKGCEDSCPVDDSWGIIFLKHNVRDDYDELTDLARFYAIRVVPSFTFFQNGSPIKHLMILANVDIRTRMILLSPSASQ
ncbi:hypothetical protein GOP47_0020489 [Adiantum capillus-veneris]|uniref:Thioredoxin domain-containing protein n=1 Tax=Adiantum capillus-veneris TaxID=13818 RepID=A0A9D4Z711_ADICA|nr:hypothetical protein GOP47_0020489 [Adiantum capillus-veneris]